MEKTAKYNPLGEEKINSLLRKFALPSIVSMLVGSLYNIVDQFFIGQRVGELGNAATNFRYRLPVWLWRSYWESEVLRRLIWRWGAATGNVRSI